MRTQYNQLLRNTNRRDFNCGGYALETFNWYLPYGEDFPKYWSRAVSDITEDMVAYMLADKLGLRVINSLTELAPTEYAIAFRVGCGDFHFIKRGHNGQWYSKMGSSREIERVPEHNVFCEPWPGFGMQYDGPIVLFAKEYQDVSL